MTAKRPQSFQGGWKLGASEESTEGTELKRGTWHAPALTELLRHASSLTPPQTPGEPFQSGCQKDIRCNMFLQKSTCLSSLRVLLPDSSSDCSIACLLHPVAPSVFPCFLPIAEMALYLLKDNQKTNKWASKQTNKKVEEARGSR